MGEKVKATLAQVAELIASAEMKLLVGIPAPYKSILRYQITAHGAMRASGLLRAPLTAQAVAAIVCSCIPRKFIEAEPLVCEVIPLSPGWDWLRDRFDVGNVPPDAGDVSIERVTRFRRQMGCAD